jgi:hypothetical protein
MTNWFGEDKLFTPAVVVGVFIIVIFMSVVIGGAIK